MSNSWSKFDVDQANARRQKSKPVGDKPQRYKAEIAVEKEMHRLFRQWLQLNNVGFIEARMDRKSELPKGHPDFTVYTDGRVGFIEFKCGNNDLSVEQEERIAFLKSIGCAVLVSRDVAEAIAWTRRCGFFQHESR